MNEYKVKLNNDEKNIEAVNPLMAAQKAFPKTFNYPYIDTVGMKAVDHNKWWIGLRSTVMYVNIDIEQIL